MSKEKIVPMDRVRSRENLEITKAETVCEGNDNLAHARLENDPLYALELFFAHSHFHSFIFGILSFSGSLNSNPLSKVWN